MTDETKTLHLTVNRFWFDKIAMGIKKTDYRKMSTYWYQRLWQEVKTPRHYDEVSIRNGYSLISPVLRAKYEGVYLVHAQTKVTYSDGTILIPGSSYGIKIGEILSIQNWHGPLEQPKPKRPIFLSDLIRKS